MFEDVKRTLQKDGTVTMTVRARPNARTTKLIGMLADGSFKIDVHAPPEDGEANAELLGFLAEEFEVPRTHVELLSGATGRLKVVRIMRV